MIACPDVRYPEVACPTCERRSDSIKCYPFTSLLFFFAAAIRRTKNEVGCPACMRGKILRLCLLNGAAQQ